MKLITATTLMMGIMAGLILNPSPDLWAGASEKHTLGIYGNANEDGVIDMRDVTSIERMVQGVIPETSLADADHDGKVDALDIIQTEQMIAEREKVLTIVDNDGDAVRVRRPVRRVIADHITSMAAMRVIDAGDLIAGIDTAAVKWMGPTFLHDLAARPVIGSFSSPDYEAVLSLKPDIYLSYRSVYGPGGKDLLMEKLPGITVIETGYYTPYNPEKLPTDLRKLGYILDRRQQAEDYIDWYTDYFQMIKSRAAGLSEHEKQRVYPAPGWDLYNAIANFRLADFAGGINICAGMGPTYITVDPEWVIRQNPDVILKQSFESKAYDSDDPSGFIAEREGILNRPELSGVSAIKNKRVYLWHMYTSGMFPNDIITLAYIAKWLHPDLYADLDPNRVHQEYLDRFTPLDFNVTQHGVFVYPPFED